MRPRWRDSVVPCMAKREVSLECVRRFQRKELADFHCFIGSRWRGKASCQGDSELSEGS